MRTYLLVANGEFALGFLVRLGVGVKLFDGFVVLRHGLCKFDVALSVLMTRVDFGVIW